MLRKNGSPQNSPLRHKIDMNPITIQNIEPKFAPALAQLQRDCFPTLGDDEKPIS